MLNNLEHAPIALPMTQEKLAQAKKSTRKPEKQDLFFLKKTRWNYTDEIRAGKILRYA
jgi:hypothetical protein